MTPTKIMLAWSQHELSVYTELNLIPPMTTLVDGWSNGKLLIAMAHRFFPELVPNLTSQLSAPDGLLKISEVYEQTGIYLPELTVHNVEECVSRIHAYVIQHESKEVDVLFEKQSISLLSRLSQLNHQWIDSHLSREGSCTSSRAPSPFHPRTEEEEESEDIEGVLQQLEQHDIPEFRQFIGQLPSDLRTHPDYTARISAIDATHAALLLQLHKGDAYRNTILFTSTLSHIRNELEFIQAKMLKTTTTDAGIQDLESRSQRAGRMIDEMTVQFNQLLVLNENADITFQHQLDALISKYGLVCAWVEDVRIWFIEAERIRHWMENVMKTLEGKEQRDILNDVELEYTMEEVMRLNEEHDQLEKQVDTFNKKDMARLRAHVKALTGTERGNKELSPADTTTIEITFTTLMTLDKLQHQLRRHSYELQMLTYRIYWEQEYDKTHLWIRHTHDQLKQFIQQARWTPVQSSPQDIIHQLIQYEQQAILFDQSQFTTTVNMYQDLDDNCNTELPMHLESRQVAVEEAFNELKNRIGYCRQVVEQYLALSDFIEKTDRLKTEGEQLRQEINHAEEYAVGGKEREYADKVNMFQEHAIRLMTHVASRIPYPEAVHPLDQQGNDESNDTIHMVVGKSKSALRLLGEALEQSLIAHKRVLQLQKRAKQIQDEVVRLNGAVDDRLKLLKKTKVDVFVGKCALDETDLARLKKERNGQMAKMKNIQENELSRIMGHIQQLEQSCQSNNTHQSTIVTTLRQDIGHIQTKLDTLKDLLDHHSLSLDILSLRIAWETQHLKSTQWISSMIFNYWEFIANKAQWRSEYIYSLDHEEIISEYEDMKHKVDAFYQCQYTPVDAIFNELVSGFKRIEDHPQSTPEHVQRRHDALKQSCTNLMDLQSFTAQVIHQKKSFSLFFNQGSELKNDGQSLLSDILVAIKEVESNRLEYLESSVKDYSQGVFEFWVNIGSTLPYPHCNEDARATRPSTVDDDISTEISGVVFKVYADLQELVKRMHESLQKLGLAVHFKEELETACADIMLLHDTACSLITDITHQKYDLYSSTFVLPQMDDDTMESCRHSQNTFYSQLSAIRIEDIKTRVDILKKTILEANCESVDITILDQPLSHLEKSVLQLNHSYQLYSAQIDVCGSRLSWQQMMITHESILNTMYNTLREIVNEKNMWISKDTVDSHDTTLTVLLDKLIVQNEHIKKYALNEMVSVKEAFKKMEEDYRCLRNMTSIDMNTALSDQQMDLERLLNKTRDLVSLQISEVKCLITRHDWECRTDIALKQCHELEVDIELSIETARWSPDHVYTGNTNEHAVEEQVQQMTQLLQEIKDLQSKGQKEQTHYVQTEAVFRKKVALESAVERIRNHTSFLQEVATQNNKVREYIVQLSALEQWADTLKQHFLAADDKRDEQDQSLNEYRTRVASVKCIHKEVQYPVRHFINHDPQSREKDISHNTVIHDLLSTKEVNLEELGHALESVLKSKERLSRRRGAEESYMADAVSVKDWISTHTHTVDGLVQSLAHTPVDIDQLRSDVNLAAGVHSSVHAYTNTIDALKESSNKYIRMIEQYTDGTEDNSDAKGKIERIKTNQMEVHERWNKLKQTSCKVKGDLSTLLRKTEFYLLADSYHSQRDVFYQKMLDDDITQITEEITMGWQSELPGMETKFIDQIKVRMSEERMKYQQMEGVSESELEAMKKTRDGIIEDFNQLKLTMHERINEINHHRMKSKYMSGADVIMQLMMTMKQSLEDMKSHQGLIKGIPTEDEHSLHTLREIYDAISNDYDIHMEKYDEQRSFHRFLQLNEVPDLEDIDQLQHQLDNEWKELKSILSNDKQFLNNIAQWYDIQKQMNKVKNSTLVTMEDRLNAFENVSHDMPTFFEEDKNTLIQLHTTAESFIDTANTLSDNKEVAANHIIKDNHMYFTLKYDELEKYLNRLEELLEVKMDQAQKELQFKHLDQMMAGFENDITEEIALMKQRMDNISAVTSDCIKPLEQVYKKVATDFPLTEEKEHRMRHDMPGILAFIHNVQSKYTDDISTAYAKDKEESVSTLSVLFSESILTEKTVHDVLRKVLGHFKSAESITHWIDNCNMAIQNVYAITDQAADEKEAEQMTLSLEQKIADFDKIMQSFRDLITDITSTPIPTQPMLNQEQAKKTLLSLAENTSMHVESKWTSMLNDMQQVKTTVQKNTKGVHIARKMKKIMNCLGDTRDHINDLKLMTADMTDSCSVTVTDASDSYTEYEDDIPHLQDNDSQPSIIHIELSDHSTPSVNGTDITDETDSIADKYSLYAQFTSMPREDEVVMIQKNLQLVEDDTKPLIQQEMMDLDRMIEGYDDTDGVFSSQHAEIKGAVSSLYALISHKQHELDKALDMGKYLKYADEYEMLHSYMESAISKAALHHATVVGTNFVRSDLYSRLFELEAQYSCYEPQIIQCLSDAKDEAAKVVNHKELIKLHLEEISSKWTTLKKQFKARQTELNRAIETAVDRKEQHVRARKSSLPTRKANSLLRDRGDVLLARQQSAMNRLSPTLGNSRSNSSASNRLGRSTSSSLQNTAGRNTRFLTPPLPTGSQNHQPSKSASSLRSKPRLSTSKAPLNSYVADPLNMLDMEIGRIVNETPYRVKVKMVPGETGRYWFGDTNPKLAYCRVLKSKMVMVRVGGGWTELSQFLRDHALLDGDFIPRNRTNMIPEEDEELKSPEIVDGFIETRRAQLPSGKLMPIPSATPARHPQTPFAHRPSKSINNLNVPANPIGAPSLSSTSQAGYKDGDKFITVDQNGNQMEVKMRRVSGDINDMERKSKASNDYTRRRLAKRKEKPLATAIN